MNLFRSEEHVRNWSGFKADTEEGINQLSDVIGLFSLNFFTRRLEAAKMNPSLLKLQSTPLDNPPYGTRSQRPSVG